MVSHKNYNLNVNEDFVIFLTSKVKYVLHWWFHLWNEIAINCLYANWKCTYILDLRPWRWSALNMGFVIKRPARMQGQFLFRSWAGRTTCFGRVPKFPWRASLTPIWHPRKFVWGWLLFDEKKLDVNLIQMLLLWVLELSRFRDIFKSLKTLKTKRYLWGCLTLFR
jgi:hypothetical protein